MTSNTATRGGLEGVVAADSAIGKIDGEVGELRYRGYLITELAEHSTFVETTHLLWHGELPDAAQLQLLDEGLRARRAMPSAAAAVLRSVANGQEPMDALRTTVSVLSVGDDLADVTDPAANIERAMRLAAQIPTIVAAYQRLRNGQEPVEPRADLAHAANFLYMLTGEEPSEDVAHMLDVALILHAEHGFNASTFAARVTAGTLADIYGAVTSAIGTLKGALHGGANTAVMNTLLGIDGVDAVEAWVDDALARRAKIMGFGHRVYKVVDPRALILKDFARRLADLGDSRWFEMSEKMEAVVKDRKGIDVNVDFYSASMYYALGIPPDLYTCLFAVSRVSGWTAHVMEQYANNRLIRPRSNWVGAEPRSYVPVERRG